MIHVADCGWVTGVRRYDICTTCQINHYADCGSCFGFGLKQTADNGDVPVIAWDAHHGNFDINRIPCHECGSTVKGIPAASSTSDLGTDVQGTPDATARDIADCIRHRGHHGHQ